MCRSKGNPRVTLAGLRAVPEMRSLVARRELRCVNTRLLSIDPLILQASGAHQSREEVGIHPVAEYGSHCREPSGFVDRLDITRVRLLSALPFGNSQGREDAATVR